MSGFLDKVFGSSTHAVTQELPAQSAQSTQSTQSTQTPAQTMQQESPVDANNLALTDNIWDDKPTQAPQGENNFSQQQQNAANQQQPQQQAVSTPQEQFAAHIDSLNLTANVDLDKIQADMQQGDTASLGDAFKQVATNVYKSTMLEMNSLVDSKLEQVKKEAAQTSADNWNADLAVREMNTKLPFTSDPNIAPVATAVLNRFIEKGVSVAEAIKSTQDFFASTAEKINGASMPPSGTPGSTQFNQQNVNSNNQKPASGHDDWLEVLAQSN